LWEDFLLASLPSLDQSEDGQTDGGLSETGMKHDSYPSFFITLKPDENG